MARSVVLALVEDDYGTEVAQSVARWLVLYLRRPGGAAHCVAAMARRAAMSPRHFTRVFTGEVGEAPGSYVERIRTEAARRQLEETDDTVGAIAARCGFGTAETMRRNFIRRVGVSPDRYRKTFA